MLFLPPSLILRCQTDAKTRSGGQGSKEALERALTPGAWVLPTLPTLPCSAWPGSWDGAASCQKVLIVV